ncbi:MAG: 2Fe-2S iron-sulfur cluster-binding protein [Microbacteriaceae bacterium]
MAKITFNLEDGTAQTIDAEDGEFLMQEAVNNSVPGIDGDCGGVASCATCHVYVEPEWLAATGERTDMEEAMLDGTFGVEPNSRLCCQIQVSDKIDGLVVQVAGT